MFCLYKILNIFLISSNALKYCKKIKASVKEFRILYVEGGEATPPSQCVLTVSQSYLAGPTVSASAALLPAGFTDVRPFWGLPGVTFCEFVSFADSQSALYKIPLLFKQFPKVLLR